MDYPASFFFARFFVLVGYGYRAAWLVCLVLAVFSRESTYLPVLHQVPV